MFAIKRHKTRLVTIGGVKVGSPAPITVQSMTKVRAADVKKTVRQILELEDAGCEIIRPAVLDMDDARAIKEIRKHIHIPLEADIHFAPHLALEAIKAGTDGVRLNPGNLKNKNEIKKITLAAKKRGISIRVGANSGSIVPRHAGKKTIAQMYKHMQDLMVKETLAYCRYIESFGFHNIMVSLKASDVLTTVYAYRKFAGISDYPLHLGITAAGPIETSTIKSAIGIGSLLMEGIGDTIRVSITGNPVDEIKLGFEILSALNIRRKGPEIISCPTCGRCKSDIIGTTRKLQELLENSDIKAKIAVMGCVVNGPGEAMDADIGIAAGDDYAVLFKNGRIIKNKIPFKSVISVILKELESSHS